MRIAYVINSLEGGGAATPVPAVAQVLIAQGATVEIFALTRRDGRGGGPIAAAGLAAHLRAEGGERDHVAAVRWLDGQMDKFRPDVIWTSLTRATLLGQWVGARRGTTVVSWQHNGYLKPSNLLLLRARQRFSSLWIGDSQSVTALTAARLGVPAERLTTWPLFAADPHAPKAKPWTPGEVVRIGSLGRLHPAKGYDVLIGALAKLKANGFEPPAPFEVRIGGDGAERSRLEAAMAAAGVHNLRLAGFIDRPNQFLADLHLYVQPSRREGLCIAAHEAMQAGLPIIASAVGEMPNTVLPGTAGLIVPARDADALAGALMAMVSHPERLAALGASARERVLDRFSVDAFAQAGMAVMARLRARRAP